MTSFPASVYSPRTKANRPGVVYTPTKTTVGYAEDVSKLDDEVVAVENYLKNPAGSPAGSIQIVVGELMSGDCDGLNYVFVSSQIPIAGSYALYQNGVRLREVSAGVGDFVVAGQNFTLSNPPAEEAGRPMLDYKYIKV